MASENTPKGRRQIALALVGVAVAMMLAAGLMYVVGGRHGLQSPSSSASTMKS